MQFFIKFSFNFKRSAPPASRQTDSMHSDILARSATQLSQVRAAPLCIMNYAFKIYLTIRTLVVPPPEPLAGDARIV